MFLKFIRKKRFKSNTRMLSLLYCVKNLGYIPINPIIKDLVAPAAVFYFDSPEGPFGTVFYRERNTNFERLNNIVNVTKHCIRFANQSYACGGQHKM